MRREWILDPKRYLATSLLQNWIDNVRPKYRLGIYRTANLQFIAEMHDATKEEALERRILGHFAIEASYKRGEDARKGGIATASTQKSDG